MRSLSIDIETFSDLDLTKVGVHKYVESSSFRLLLFAYSWTGEADINIIDIENGEEIPEDIINALNDDTVTKHAFNAQFERLALSKHLSTKLDAKEWACTMCHAYMAGLSGGLKEVGQKLHINEDSQKLKTGKALIKKFSIKGDRPEDFPEEWGQFKEYCKQDVLAEMTIAEKLENIIEFSHSERLLYALDQNINDRGIPVDVAFVEKVLLIDKLNKEKLNLELMSLTHLSNPNSPKQLTNWIEKTENIELSSLNKDTLKDLTFKSGDVIRALELRSELSKTSLTKYETLLDYEMNGRIYGQIQFYGAGRTGRFAGRGIQVHNLPQNHIEDLDNAREIVAEYYLIPESKREILKLLYGNVSNVLSELIRTSIKAPIGRTLVVADFSAIEARVIAWLSGEKWRQDVFATHGKIYEASASEMFNVPIEQVTKGSDLRQKGKISELALGYGGSVGALTSMGAIRMGLDESELQPLVKTWRKANPNIVNLWKSVERASINTIKGTPYKKVNYLDFTYKRGHLYITLPSKRKLVYLNAKVVLGKFDNDAVEYDGKNGREDTFGGKLVENIVQAISRDILALILARVKDLDIVFHVHDEVVIEVLESQSEKVLDYVLLEMSKPIAWAKGLNLKGDGYITPYYKKD